MAGFIEWIGYLSLSYVSINLIYKLWQIIYPFIIAKSMASKRNLKQLSGGSWTVITGATDGIGKAYASQLLRRGLNVVLISRNSEKLQSVAKEFENLYPSSEIKWIAFDFSNAGASDYKKIKDGLVGLDVGILVNNVGVSFSYPERFHLLPEPDTVITNNITVNCLATAMMTRLVLTGFVEKNKGIVINIGSQSASLPTPYLGLYSATKKFVEYFTHSLRAEYANTGIIFQLVMPFFVSTKMSKMRPSFTSPDADTYVKSALDTVGIQSQTSGYLAHALQGLPLSFLPQWLHTRLVMRVLKTSRAKYLRKQEKQK